MSFDESKTEPEVEREAPNSSRRQLRSSRVSFGEVEIREYARCLGNHPTTTHGPSLSIDWQYEASDSFKVDDFEEDRAGRKPMPRDKPIPGVLRESIIKQHTECTKQDIAKNVSELRSARHQRQMSVALQEYEPWHVVFESVKRKWKRWRNGISKKKEQEKLWEEAKEGQGLPKERPNGATPKAPATELDGSSSTGRTSPMIEDLAEC